MFLNQTLPPPFLKGWSVIFFGGDVNIGRRTNWNPNKKPFGNLPAMTEADLRIVNLECVIAAQGQQGIDKGESGPYYYHARSEQTNLLSEAKIDVALTANNHSLDFYEAALLEQNNYLDRAGILHLGTGKNLDEATRPLFIKVRDNVVALFNVDATMKPFAATADKPGTFYLPPDKPELWQKFFTEKIADARKKADVVLVAPHWGINFVEEPMEQIKTLGRLLIDCGADAVLGCHSHLLQGVETYKQRPIIYDAGNFFWDEKPKSGGAFALVISKRGVEKLFFASFITDRCKISPATAEQSKPFCAKFLDACRKLNSEGIAIASDLIEFKFEPPPRDEKILEPVELSSSRRGEKIPAMTEPLPEWTPDKVPTVQPPNITVDSNQGVEIDEFKREFKNKNGVMFFMLRGIKPKAPGLEQSSFRRAKLFREHFGIEINFVTHEYQNDILEQRDNYGLNVRVLNMYDYFQEINRDIEKPRKVFIGSMKDGWQIERPDNRDLRVYRSNGKLAMYCVFALKDQKLSYINFFNEDGKKFRRDIYDMLGFLSARQELENERPKEISYYRPDGTLAIHEIYQIVKGKNTFAFMELVNRAGNVTKTFSNRDNALSYFLMQNLNDATKNYFLIGDRTPEWHEAYADIKSAGLNNVRVIHQLHNVHVRAPYDPLTSELKPRNKYFLDDKYKADAIITLTTKQKLDIVKRYNLNNVVTLPHSLTAVPKVTDVKLNPFQIVQVGRIVEEKGHAKAVEVMKRVIEKVPQATLHFYGSGSLQSKVQELIDANNLGAQIKFEGFSENMPVVFASSALSILPSAFEGSPLVIQESLQQDCPVVAFDCTYGPSDSIVNGVNGYLVPVGDAEAMADRIIKILTEPGLRDKLSANCAKSIEKFYPEVVARQWAKLFCNFMRQ